MNPIAFIVNILIRTLQGTMHYLSHFWNQQSYSTVLVSDGSGLEVSFGTQPALIMLSYLERQPVPGSLPVIGRHVAHLPGISSWNCPADLFAPTECNPPLQVCITHILVSWWNIQPHFIQYHKKPPPRKHYSKQTALRPMWQVTIPTRPASAVCESAAVTENLGLKGDALYLLVTGAKVCWSCIASAACWACVPRRCLRHIHRHSALLCQTSHAASPVQASYLPGSCSCSVGTTAPRHSK